MALSADGVVLTGSGPPITVPGQPQDHPRVLDGQNYWLHERRLKKAIAQSVCVIGSGEVAYDTVGMAVAKRRSDLFRHWILGLGSGVGVAGFHHQSRMKQRFRGEAARDRCRAD